MINTVSKIHIQLPTVERSIVYHPLWQRLDGPRSYATRPISPTSLSAWRQFKHHVHVALPPPGAWTGFVPTGSAESSTSAPTSWFKLKDGNSLAHECRLDCLFDCHIFSVRLTAVNSARGWHGQVFCSGPRTGASGENVSPPTTGLRKRQEWSGVSVGKQHLSFFFLNEPIAGTIRHADKMFCANIRRSNWWSNVYRPKLIL